MKKELILLVLLSIILFFSCHYIDDSNKNSFKLIKNGKILFLFENTIDNQIKYKISNKFDIFVKEVFKQNGILENKNFDLRSENILIILVEDNFHNVKYVDDGTKKRINKFRKMKNGSDFSRILYDFRISDNNSSIYGLFYANNNIIIINNKKIKNSEFKETFLFNILLSELNHYFISNNLIKNFKNKYIDYINNYVYNDEIRKIKLLDESITHFFGNYLTYHYCFMYKNNNIINLLNMNLSFSDYIFEDFYIKNIKSEIVKFPFKSIENFSFGGMSINDLIPYYISLSLYIYQKYNSFEIIKKFINFMYEAKFNSFNDIIYYNFKLSEDKFFKEWEDFTKKLFY